MICEKCGAPMPEEGGACPLCDWAPGMEEEPVPQEVPAEAEASAQPAEMDSPEPAPDHEAPSDDQPDELAPMKKHAKALVIAAVGILAVVAVAVALIFLFRGGRTSSPADKVLEMVECLPANETDVAMTTVGLKGDTVLLTVEGQDITAEEYLYWLGNITNYYDLMSRYSGSAMDLTREAEEGVTWDEQLKRAARDNSVLLALTPILAREVGADLSEEDLQQVVDGRADGIEAAGGAEMYAYQLQAMGINDATALRMDATVALYNNFQQAWMEKTVQDLTAEDMADYIQKNDLLRAKHILLLTRDMTTGAALSQEEQARKKAQADDLLAQLRADPDKFDQLMNENSEDSGLAQNPDGYIFTAGQMVESFVQGVRDMEFGQISEVIESEYGYHIILRLDPDCEESRQSLASSRFNEEIQTRVDQAQVKETEAYQGFTTAQYYEALLAFQESLVEPETVDQSRGELEPAS